MISRSLPILLRIIAGIILLTLLTSQFVLVEVDMSHPYAGISCFGPYVGYSSARPRVALHLSPVLRPLSISTFLTRPALSHSGSYSSLELPWWLLLTAAVCCWRLRKPASPRAFPIDVAPPALPLDPGSFSP